MRSWNHDREPLVGCVRVVTPPVSNAGIITLGQAKLHARVDGTEEDDSIAAFITAVRMHAENKTRRAVALQTLAVTFPRFPHEGGKLEIPKPPLVTVESVVYADPTGALQTLASNAYFSFTASDSIPAEVYPTIGTSWPDTQRDNPQAVVVTYQAGWTADNIPQPIVNWMLCRVAELYEHRERVSVGQSISVFPADIIDELLSPYIITQRF